MPDCRWPESHEACAEGIDRHRILTTDKQLDFLGQSLSGTSVAFHAKISVDDHEMGSNGHVNIHDCLIEIVMERPLVLLPIASEKIFQPTCYLRLTVSLQLWVVDEEVAFSKERRHLQRRKP